MSISSFAHFYRSAMGQSCTIESYLGITGNNQRSYGTLRTYQCNVWADYVLIVNAAGQQVVSSARTHIYPVANDLTPLLAMTVDDRITLPDGKQPRIHNVNTQRDQLGRIMLYQIWT